MISSSVAKLSRSRLNPCAKHGRPGKSASGVGGLLRRLALMTDLVLVALATIVAVMLRGNFDTLSDTLTNLMPYTLISVGCPAVVFIAAGLDRTPWKYSSVADHLQVIVLTALAMLLALVLTFALNRLEPVARSLPVFQG